MSRADSLPIDALIPNIKKFLATSSCLVLQAPPGAGKTTRVPLALLDAPWLQGRKIVMLEPRRLAARAAATRMAQQLGEKVGQTVGYRVRFDSKVSSSTKIEVVTDGLFLRQLQNDPELQGVGVVIFDEFHERSLDIDLSLALAREAQILREDLRLIVMSATLDAMPVAKLLDNAPVLTSEGRTFPVTTYYLPVAVQDDIEDAVVRQIRQAWAEETGNMLVFLPGQSEIRRVEQQVCEALPAALVAPLYGDLSIEAQERAILPAPPGQRKIVLATSIAETSLTIEGVCIVIDSGLARLPRFDPNNGLTSLVTQTVSQAAADQRRGRAGRTEPGVCYRLWTESQQRILPAFAPPEIRDADLAPLCLELACWGTRDAQSLCWLDPPHVGSVNVAQELLKELDALDFDSRVTPHGQQMNRLALHPRLAHMVLRGAAWGEGEQAAALAALLSERDILRGDQARLVDVGLRLDEFSRKENAFFQIKKIKDQILKFLPPFVGEGQGGGRDISEPLTRRYVPPSSTKGRGKDSVGALLALAYPDRIAQRRPETVGQFLLANGRGATLPKTDPLASQDYLAVARVEGTGRDARIFLAAPLDLKDLETVFRNHIQTTDYIAWDHEAKTVLCRRQKKYEQLILQEHPLSSPNQDKVADAFLDGVRQEGLGLLPWPKETESWRQRVNFLRWVEPETAWPDVSDKGLLDQLDIWLRPFVQGVTRPEKLNLIEALETLLDWPLRQRLDKEAPTHIQVPSSSRIALDYSGETPVLAVRLQEMFGLADTPRIAGGRVALLIHLLSPGYRPVQVTQDLASFWKNGYPAVRSDLRGRYPRHSWPDNPLEAPPTRRVKRPK